jgi:hypothetical protein
MFERNNIKRTARGAECIESFMCVPLELTSPSYLTCFDPSTTHA